MTLQQIHKTMVFCMLAKIGSIRIVADKLNMHRSSILRSINALEDDLNTKLITMEGREPILTSAGKQFFAQFSDTVDLIQEAYDSAQFLVRDAFSDAPVVRVVMPSLVGDAYFDSLDSTSKDFHVKFSHYNYLEVMKHPERILDQASRMDIGIFPADCLDPYLEPHYEKVHSFSVTYSLMGTPDFIGVHRIDQKNFRQYIFSVTEDMLYSSPVLKGIAPVYEVENVGMLLKAYAKSGGLIFCPESAVRERLRSGELMRILPKFDYRFEHVIYRKAELEENRKAISDQLIERLIATL